MRGFRSEVCGVFGIVDVFESERVGRFFFEALDFGIEIRARTRSVSDVAMSHEIGGFVIFDVAVPRTPAFSVRIRRFREVYAVFFRERLED